MGHICDKKIKKITHSFFNFFKKKTYCPHLIWSLSTLGLGHGPNSLGLGPAQQTSLQSLLFSGNLLNGSIPLGNGNVEGSSL